MNRRIALAFAITCAAAGSAWADDITIDPNPFVPARTRAEVMAEQGQFRQSAVNPWSDEYDQLAQFRSDRARAELKAEYLLSRREVAAFTAEDSGSTYLARTTAPRMRAPMMDLARAE